MIYTQFGTPVQIIQYHPETAELTARRKDGSEITARISCFKADRGAQEIYEAVQCVAGVVI